MKFTKNNAIEQMYELNHEAIEDMDASKSFKTLCHYFVSSYKENGDIRIDLNIFNKQHNKLCKQHNVELSLEDR